MLLCFSPFLNLRTYPYPVFLVFRSVAFYSATQPGAYPNTSLALTWRRGSVFCGETNKLIVCIERGEEYPSTRQSLNDPLFFVCCYLPKRCSSKYLSGGKTTAVKPIPSQSPRSPPASPRCLAAGPTHHTWDIPTIGPTHPTRNAINAATPTGNSDLSS